ncbi:unnamed protein product, partial [Urochloa humidicola]
MLHRPPRASLAGTAGCPKPISLRQRHCNSAATTTIGVVAARQKHGDDATTTSGPDDAHSDAGHADAAHAAEEAEEDPATMFSIHSVAATLSSIRCWASRWAAL